MKFSRMMILFLVFSLAVSGACADSLFSLLPASAPEETPAAAHEPAAYEGSLFDQLAGPAEDPVSTPAPLPAETPALISTQEPVPSTAGTDASARFCGLSFTDLAGRSADRVTDNQREGTVEFIYEQVSQNDFDSYEQFLHGKGCGSRKLQANPETASACLIHCWEPEYDFMVIYEADRCLLTLVCTPETEEAGTVPEHASGETGEAGRHAGTPEPGSRTGENAADACPFCHNGRCSTCRGRGVIKCSACAGLGRCKSCHGNRHSYTAGYNGVGSGRYDDCAACGGTGKCGQCEGMGRITCPACDNGVCSACGGHS